MPRLHAMLAVHTNRSACWLRADALLVGRPAVMHIAGALALQRHVVPALEQLHASLKARSDEWHDVIKIGRTHTQDATPLTLGQEFSGYATQVGFPPAAAGLQGAV